MDHVKVGRLGPFPRVSKPVFLTSAILILAFIIFGAFFNELASEVFGQAKAFVSMRFGWVFYHGGQLNVGDEYLSDI